jgi:hypothetical protein
MLNGTAPNIVELLEIVLGNILVLPSEDCKEISQDDFVRRAFTTTEINPPNIENIITQGADIHFRELQNCDIAVYNNGQEYLAGIVIGSVGRQICYIDPISKKNLATYFDDMIEDFKYLAGWKIPAEYK